MTSELPSDRRWWRLAFVLYVIAATVLTHWPHMSLGGPEGPSPDKLLHTYVFGGLTALLWMTGWVRSILLLAAIMFGWLVIDELTQALPGLGRSITLFDMMASGAGVIIACAWIWALRPVGGELSRARYAFRSRILFSIFARPLHEMTSALAWLLIGAAFIPIGLAITFFFGSVVGSLPNGIPALFFGLGIAIWLGVILTIWNWLWKRELSAALDRRMCPNCGESQGEVRPICEFCGTRISACIWLPDVAPEGPVRRRMLVGPVIIGVLFCAIVFGAIYALAVVQNVITTYGWAASGDWVGRILYEFGDIPQDTSAAIDSAVLLVACAAAIYFYRRSWAKVFDKQGAICRRCGHDLRGTPVDENHIGVCGECGTQFVRPNQTQSV